MSKEKSVVNCEIEDTFFISVKDKAIEILKCPIRYIYDNIAYQKVIEFFSFFKLYKVLPYDGNLLKQPYWIYDYFSFISSEVCKIEQMLYEAK